MLNRFELALAVRHANVAMGHALGFSEAYFYGIEPGSFWHDQRVLAACSEPLVLARRAFVVIEGDLTAPCELSQGGVLIVRGACRSAIQVRTHSEVILAGDLEDGISVRGDGITHVFIGGDLRGELDLNGSLEAWIGGSLLGRVRTGVPNAHLRVQGDCMGVIEPGTKAALLLLLVEGFMPSQAIEAIAARHYTLFHASIRSSDRPAGLYPELAASDNPLREHRQNRWVIRRNVDGRS
ncbi:MAG TPA: hypothetical protein VF530_00455 [Planctomycetota bacterium]